MCASILPQEHQCVNGYAPVFMCLEGPDFAITGIKYAYINIINMQHKCDV